MHHEDKAGVNALIRGIDILNRQQLPVAVIMCTNRLSAVDPAVVRRASEIIRFDRPNLEKRRALFESTLKEIDFSSEQIDEIAKLTGEANGRNYGFTYSDITQKLFHALVMSAFPDSPISFDSAKKIAQEIKPTPPFKDA